MSRRNSNSGKGQAARRKAKRPSRNSSTGTITKQRSQRKRPRPLARQQDDKVFAAINRYRRGRAKSISAAARAEGTTLRAIRTQVPKALSQDRPGGRIRVKASDRYSAKVQVLTTDGQRVVTARGSRQRALAGRHRASVMRVLQGQESPMVLEQYRGKKFGGHELISDFALLSSFAQAGIVGQLDSLYVSPDASA